MSFEYSAEWYAGEYVEPWIDRVNSSDDLLKEYERQARWVSRLGQWFKPFPSLSGSLLELGFNDGKTIYWLSKNRPDLQIYAIDWNATLRKLEPYLRELLGPCLRHIIFCRCTDVPYSPGFFDHVTSIDFFEHLPEDVYFECLDECRRVLRPGGMFFVYLGTTKLPEHINLRPVQQVEDEVESAGFTKRLRVSADGHHMSVFER